VHLGPRLVHQLETRIGGAARPFSITTGTDLRLEETDRLEHAAPDQEVGRHARPVGFYLAFDVKVPEGIGQLAKGGVVGKHEAHLSTHEVGTFCDEGGHTATYPIPAGETIGVGECDDRTAGSCDSRIPSRVRTAIGRLGEQGDRVGFDHVPGSVVRPVVHHDDLPAIGRIALREQTIETPPDASRTVEDGHDHRNKRFFFAHPQSMICRFPNSRVHLTTLENAPLASNYNGTTLRSPKASRDALRYSAQPPDLDMQHTTPTAADTVERSVPDAKGKDRRLPPMVSVIIPVLNDPDGIRRCIDALRRQSYPEDRYELIVVDNGSTDSTPDVAAELGARLFRETTKKGSYAARNTGLENADGEILAFTDADCTPSRCWIEEGVRPMNEDGADLVGGRVRFRLARHPTGAEVWDSVTNMQIDENIRTRGVAKTANLFAGQHVFDEIGDFPDDMTSGGDVAWTERATGHGFKLVYAPLAEVEHPARRLASLIAKQYRVGTGQAALMEREGQRSRQLRRILGRLRPPSIRSTEIPLARAEKPPSRLLFCRVWAAAWLANAATGLGTAAGLISRSSGRGATDR
jgi:hypothetical protein